MWTLSFIDKHIKMCFKLNQNHTTEEEFYIFDRGYHLQMLTLFILLNIWNSCVEQFIKVKLSIRISSNSPRIKRFLLMKILFIEGRVEYPIFKGLPNFYFVNMEICCFKFNENHMTDTYWNYFRRTANRAPFSNVNLDFYCEAYAIVLSPF